MARAHPRIDKGRDGGELNHRLGNPATRVGNEPGAKLGKFGAGCRRTHDEALAPGTVDGLHHQLVEAVEHLFEGGRVFEAPSVDVFEDWFFAEVIADEVGQVGVHELVVGDTVADRVGNGDVAEAGREHEARGAQHRVGPKLQRVQKLVVNATVDHIDAHRTCGRSHPHPATRAEQVATFDQLDAHQAREQGVFVIGGVVDAGGEHDNVGVTHTLRRARP